MATLGAEPGDQAPAYVYVPISDSAMAISSEEGEIQLALHEFGDGAAGLPIFTDEDRLVAVLGADQARVKIAVLDLLVRLAPVELPITVNPRLRAGA
ncbi:SseB family protein [Actinoallomurus acaciae]|uniref:SseB family protein n=1 Tax=Actinoallomurus acaciae TaxID=502577 RepID=A0ABV5YJ09_9ACTN